MNHAFGEVTTRKTRCATRARPGNASGALDTVLMNNTDEREKEDGNEIQ